MVLIVQTNLRHVVSCIPNLRALGLPKCQIILASGSLIPLPSFEAWETDQIKLQAMGFVVTLKSLRAAVILTNGN